MRPAVLIASGLCALLACGAADARSPKSASPPDANLISPKLCLVVTIPGQWEPGEDSGVWQSADGKQVVGVSEFTAADLKDSKGNTLIEKEAEALQKAHEKAFKQKLSGVTLAPFETSRFTMWKWSANPVRIKGRELPIENRYFIDLSPEGVIVIKIEGTGNDDEMARTIIARIKHSAARPCQLPTSAEEVMDMATGKASPKPAPRYTASIPQNFKNPIYPWAVQYPAGWLVQPQRAGAIQFLSPAPGDAAGCTIYSAGVKFASVEEAAEFWLKNSMEQMKSEGIEAKFSKFYPISLPNGVNGLDVFKELSRGSISDKARQIFALVDGHGYSIDCETSAANWRTLSPVFGEIIASFRIEKKSP